MLKVKKVAAIHDMSGLGRCSLTAAIPILSVLGVQACPFPTAILSCQTGYESFSFLDLTEEMVEYKSNWNDMGFKFDGIYSGFLGSDKQIDIVKDFIISQNCSFVLVDPVMGDDGKVYKTYTKLMCEKMKNLVSYADITTPNITEACILADVDYSNGKLSLDEIQIIAEKICDLGPKKVVITGILKGNEIINYAYDKENKESFFTCKKRKETSYGGTGDIFASILCGILINNGGFKEAVFKATDFVYAAMENSADDDIKNGVVFEPLLKELICSE